MAYLLTTCKCGVNINLLDIYFSWCRSDFPLFRVHFMPQQLIWWIVSIVPLHLSGEIVIVNSLTCKEIQSSFQVMVFSFIAVTDLEELPLGTSNIRVLRCKSVWSGEKASCVGMHYNLCQHQVDIKPWLSGWLFFGLSTGPSACRTSLNLIHLSTLLLAGGREKLVAVPEIARSFLFSLWISLSGFTLPGCQPSLPYRAMFDKNVLHWAADQEE